MSEINKFVAKALVIIGSIVLFSILIMINDDFNSTSEMLNRGVGIGGFIGIGIMSFLNGFKSLNKDKE